MLKHDTFIWTKESYEACSYGNYKCLNIILNFSHPFNLKIDASSLVDTILL